jgi:hypothetical protein
MTVYGQGGHELGNYWLGQEVAQPGAAFYPAVLLWRTTPVTLLGFTLAVGFAAERLARAWPGQPTAHLPVAEPARGRGDGVTVFGLLLFVLWYSVILSTGDKKFDRYLLPIFPAVDLLAAWGWVCALTWLASQVRTEKIRRHGAFAGVLLLVAAQAAFMWAGGPTYLTAYNPLLGGMRTARQVFIVGWGEGLAEAASFLNQQPDATNHHVAAWYGLNVFGPFYHGRSYDLYYDLRTAADLYKNDVDFVVTYVNQQQRHLLDPTIQDRLGAPLYVSGPADAPLAQVFSWPKPFDHTADRLLAPGLRLLGWNIGTYDPSTGNLRLMIYWDAAELSGSPPADPRIVAWMKDGNGEVWAKAEAPVAHSHPADAWLKRPALAQEIALQAPVGLLPGTYQVELAPYAGESLALAHVSVTGAQLAGPKDGVGQRPLAGLAGAEHAVLFGDSWRLAGYSAQQTGSELSLELLWVALKPGQVERSFFVHVVDDKDQIISQHDGPMARLAGTPAATPPPEEGQLVRQRVRLTLPAATRAGSYHVYVGIYRSSDGSRSPVMADGTQSADGRYLLSAAALK